MQFLKAISLLAASAVTATASVAAPNNSNEQWVSMTPGTQFQPAEVGPNLSAPNALRLKDAQRRFLEEATATEEEISFTAETAMFADSQESYYYGYQQAWRLLGFYVDCEPSQDDGRRLSEDDENPCVRYLLWAAYVDLDYEYGGTQEYQFWDESTQSWDRSTCAGGRCAKMDCHNSDTHWQTLGFFKEAYYASEWFEQLFKHTGYCLWDEDTYEFMQENYDAWPEGCTETEYSDENGNSLYYDLKPIAQANMTIGLYTDSRCAQEYLGSYVNVADVLDDEGLSGEDLDMWNAGLNSYKICTPCPATDRRQGNNNNDRRRLDEDGAYACYDDAGYTNVNQCMKFRTKTTMETATLWNLQEAEQQGSLLPVYVDGQTLGNEEYIEPNAYAKRTREFATSQERSKKFITIASCIFAVSGLMMLALVFYRARRISKSSSLRAPLIPSDSA